MSELNKAIVRRWVDAFNQGRASALAILDEVCTPDYAMHDPSGEVGGKEAMLEFVGSLFDGLTGLWMTLDEAVAEGDRVAYRMSLGGTHEGNLMGCAPTGKKVQTQIHSVARIADGRVAEEWQAWDFHGFLQQLSSSETNKVLARQFVEDVLNKRDWGVAREILADKFIFQAWHFPEFRGWEGLKQLYESPGLEDASYSILDMVSEGDKVIVYWAGRATNRGEFLGIAPTGKIMSGEGVMTLRMAAGKIVHHMGAWDSVGMLKSLGAWPPAGQAKAASAE